VSAQIREHFQSVPGKLGRYNERDCSSVFRGKAQGALELNSRLLRLMQHSREGKPGREARRIFVLAMLCEGLPPVWFGSVAELPFAKAK